MSEQVDIKNKLVAQQDKSSVLQEVTTTSKVGVLNEIFYAVSFAVASLKELFEVFKIEVLAIADAKEAHREAWYQTKATDFQFGHQVVKGKDYYDNSVLTTDEIEASKIVKFAVAVQESDKSTLYIKIANENKQPLTEEQRIAFEAYINEVADLGVHLTVVNQEADDIKLTLDVEYNAALLNAEGIELNGSKEPVKEAVELYLSNLNFDQQYVSMFLVDALQQLPVVEIAEVKVACFKYDALSWQIINRRYPPYAGYMRVLPENLTINYIKGSVI